MDDHKLPPNETDQVQPIVHRPWPRAAGEDLHGPGDGRVAGRRQEPGMWKQRWEDNALSASDRRVLLACWYTSAVQRGLEGEAKLKSTFTHSLF